MRNFYQVIAAAGLVAAFALPANSASHDVDLTKLTCAEFTAMEADGQMTAMDAMDEMSDEMASDEMASEEVTSEDASSDAMASDDAMAADQMTAMKTACEGSPDMMAMDAMMEMDAMTSN